MMVLVGLWKLISRSFLIMVFVMLTPRLVLYPIFEYFYPSDSDPNSATAYSSPLNGLQVIVEHRRELRALEEELNYYLSPVGRHDVSKLLDRAAAIELDYAGNYKQVGDTVHSGENAEETKEYLKLVQQRQLLLGGFDLDKFLRLYSIGSRVASIFNGKALGNLHHNFGITAKHGVYLDLSKKSSEDDAKLLDGDESGEEVTDAEEICSKALDDLLKFLLDGKKLTEMVTKMAEEIEVRYEKGESLEDLDVSAQVDHFNTESKRLKDEVDVIVTKNRQALGRTREFMSSATERVKLLLHQFNSEWSQEFRKHSNFYGQLTEELVTFEPNSEVRDAGINSRSTEL